MAISQLAVAHQCTHKLGCTALCSELATLSTTVTDPRDCRGELEGKCEGTKVVHGADVCYVEDTKCEGFSWPRGKICTGLFTALTKLAGESKARLLS